MLPFGCRGDWSKERSGLRNTVAGSAMALDPLGVVPAIAMTCMTCMTGMRIAFDSLHATLEFHDPFAERSHHFRQPRPKEEQDHAGNDHQLDRTEAHECKQRGHVMALHAESGI